MPVMTVETSSLCLSVIPQDFHLFFHLVFWWNRASGAAGVNGIALQLSPSASVSEMRSR